MVWKWLPPHGGHDVAPRSPLLSVGRSMAAVCSRSQEAPIVPGSCRAAAHYSGQCFSALRLVSLSTESLAASDDDGSAGEGSSSEAISSCVPAPCRRGP